MKEPWNGKSIPERLYRLRKQIASYEMSVHDIRLVKAKGSERWRNGQIKHFEGLIRGLYDEIDALMRQQAHDFALRHPERMEHGGSLVEDRE